MMVKISMADITKTVRQLSAGEMVCFEGRDSYRALKQIDGKTKQIVSSISNFPAASDFEAAATRLFAI